MNPRIRLDLPLKSKTIFHLSKKRTNENLRTSQHSRLEFTSNFDLNSPSFLPHSHPRSSSPRMVSPSGSLPKADILTTVLLESAVPSSQPQIFQRSQDGQFFAVTSRIISITVRPSLPFFPSLPLTLPSKDSLFLGSRISLRSRLLNPSLRPQLLQAV